MLELLISILLALSLPQKTTDNNLLLINSETLSKAQSDSKYNSFGGDETLNKVATVDDIIVTENVDPENNH